MKTLPFANSLAAASGVCWIVGSLLIWILPDFSLYLAKLGLMGVQGITPVGFQFSFSDFVAGLVFTLITAWLFGFVWGWFYEKLFKM